MTCCLGETHQNKKIGYKRTMKTYQVNAYQEKLGVLLPVKVKTEYFSDYESL